MGVVHRFLAVEDEASLVLDWFRSRSSTPTEHTERGNLLFYFRGFGELSDDPKKSPLVNIFMPVRKRGVILTCGEVHFLAKPTSLFPRLAVLSCEFRKWLLHFTCVFSRRRDFKPEWNYYLEGSIQNNDSDVFALPKAMDALRKGQYFVADDDNDGRLETICIELRKRGVPGVV